MKASKCQSSKSRACMQEWLSVSNCLVRKMSNYFSPFPCDKTACAAGTNWSRAIAMICLVRRFFQFEYNFSFFATIWLRFASIWNQLNFGRSIRRNPLEYLKRNMESDMEANMENMENIFEIGDQITTEFAWNSVFRLLSFLYWSS